MPEAALSQAEAEAAEAKAEAAEAELLSLEAEAEARSLLSDEAYAKGICFSFVLVQSPLEPTFNRTNSNPNLKVARKLRTAAYTSGGVDWDKLFRFLDRNKSGALP